MNKEQKEKWLTTLKAGKYVPVKAPQSEKGEMSFFTWILTKDK